MFNKSGSAQNRADESWKADGFINISIPAATQSGKRKLGAIALKGDKKGMAELLAFLAANPANVVALMETATFDYQSASSESDDSGFILPSTSQNAPVATTGTDDLPF